VAKATAVRSLRDTPLVTRFPDALRRTRYRLNAVRITERFSPTALVALA